MIVINSSGDEVYTKDKYTIKSGDATILFDKISKATEYIDRVVWENEILIINLLRNGEIIIFEK